MDTEAYKYWKMDTTYPRISAVDGRAIVAGLHLSIIIYVKLDNVCELICRSTNVDRDRVHVISVRSGMCDNGIIGFVANEVKKVCDGWDEMTLAREYLYTGWRYPAHEWQS